MVSMTVAYGAVLSLLVQGHRLDTDLSGIEPAVYLWSAGRSFSPARTNLYPARLCPAANESCSLCRLSYPIHNRTDAVWSSE